MFQDFRHSSLPFPAYARYERHRACNSKRDAGLLSGHILASVDLVQFILL